MSDGAIILRGNTTSDTYVAELQSIYDSALRIWDPDFATTRDPKFPEKVRRDPIVQQGLDMRGNAIAARDWNLEPRSDREDEVLLASTLEDILRHHLSDFRQQRKNLAGGVFDGRAYAFIGGQREVFPAGPTAIEAEWWVPTKLKDLGERRVSLHIENGVPVWKVWSIRQREWVVADRRQLVEFIYEDHEERLGYGRGLREAIYFYFLFKTTVTREGLQGLERWAQGLPVAKIDTEREGGENEDIDTLKADFLDKLKKMRAKYGGLVVDKADEIEVKWASGHGHQMVMEWLRYLDGVITRLLTGALLPAGGGEDKGSLARAEVEEDSSESVIQYDRGVLDEVITRDLVSLVYQTNRENFAEAGLSKARCPRFRTINAKREDPEEARKNLETAQRIGMQVKKDQAYDMLGFEQPGEDDEVLEMAPPGGDPLAGLGFSKR